MTPDQAYDVLHRARLALGPEHIPPADFGETAVETIRGAIDKVQTALILKMDGVDEKRG